jgi:Flavin containing amine oxidoreductase
MAANKAERVCIIGSGPAGMGAAVTLKDLGYDVTVLEVRKDHLGGKCYTRTLCGQPLDVGATYVLPNYPRVVRFAQRAGMSLRPAAPFQHLGLNGQYRPFGTPPQPISFWSKLFEYARLGGELLQALPLLSRPIGEVDQERPDIIRHLSLPFSEWVKEHRLDYFSQVAYPLMRSFGFGYEEQQIPAAYVIQALGFFAKGGNLLRLWNVSNITLSHVSMGYGEMWTRLARGLEARRGVEFTQQPGRPAIERTEEGGVVHTTTGDVEFDRLLFACPLDRALPLIEPSSEEKELFSGDTLHSFPVWQSAVQVKGIPDAVILDRYQSYAQLGKPMISLRYSGSTACRCGSCSWFYFFGYARPGQEDSDISQAVQQVVAESGGQTEGEVQVNRWPAYFPHYASREVANGYHARLENLQGKRSTWYAGELLSGIGVEAASAYSQRLVTRNFQPQRAIHLEFGSTSSADAPSGRAKTGN